MTTSQKGRIFISYRRADSAGFAGRIYDRLVDQFGKDAIFMDVDNIGGGDDFIKVLEDAVTSCDILIALIGKQWLEIEDERGNRRLDNPEDFVRIEIASALSRDIKVIPVLLDGAIMPKSAELPENLRDLSRRNALFVNHYSFTPDIYRIIEHTKSVLKNVRKWDIIRSTIYKNPVGIGILLIVLFISLIWGINRVINNQDSKSTLITPTPLIPSFTPTITFTPTPTPTPTPTQTMTRTPTASPTPVVFNPHPYTDDYYDAFGVPMRLVTAGDFAMGFDSPAGRQDSHVPAHTVYLDAYYIDKYEVTNKLYQACVDAGVCINPTQSDSHTRDEYYKSAEYENYPVIYVNWEMAMAYCEWRGSRIPTEAEWEKAARGTDGRVYPWGNANLGCYVTNYAPGCEGDTKIVGSHLSGTSPYGLYDMVGNVSEWVYDWYDIYPATSPQENPQGPESGYYKIMRGTSWAARDPVDIAGLVYLRTRQTTPEGAFEDTGFRCAKDTP